MHFREANLKDIQQLHAIRNAVKENILSDPTRITAQDYAAYLTAKGKGWVCETGKAIVGFSIVDLENHNVWALFVSPAYEAKGIGKQLHDRMLDWYFAQTQVPIWLSTEFNTRAEAFYRKRGWQQVGTHGKEEIKFEMTFSAWNQIKMLL